jgi:hypothetical protein
MRSRAGAVSLSKRLRFRSAQERRRNERRQGNYTKADAGNVPSPPFIAKLGPVSRDCLNTPGHDNGIDRLIAESSNQAGQDKARRSRQKQRQYCRLRARKD